MLARADTNDVELCNLEAVIESNVGMAKAHLANNATLVVEIDELPAIQANSTLLSQVIINLLLNAAQAVEEVEREAHEITVKAWSDSVHTYLTVQDTGPGIPEDIRDEIMKPFFTTKPVGEGTGLGLSTTRNIVEALGGKVDFETEVGQGTTFRVVFPVG
jgi:signal transduction histidine kinase